jgi:hypothetical protein
VNSQVGKGSTFWFEIKMVNENLSGKEWSLWQSRYLTDMKKSTKYQRIFIQS